MKEHRVDRESLTQVYEHCPRRPYVELVIPSDCAEVTAATFTTLSRDQGWADDTISYTWFEVALQRPGSRTGLGAIRVQHNRAGNPEFFESKTHWDVQLSGPRIRAWLRQVRPGDTIQLVPKAVYMCWVNIIQRASIEIQYRDTLDKVDETAELLASSSHIGHAGRHAIYSPLNYQAHQIRVLVVEPGQPSAEISARFEHTNLRATSSPQPPPLAFHALSYCWGGPTETTNIALKTPDNQNSTLTISPTVHRAIRRLRNTSTPLRIWIDAVCINQPDLDERANQVALMGEIYSLATQVHIWLDDDEILGLGAAFRLIRDVYNYKHRVCPGNEQCQCPGTKHVLKTTELDGIAQETKDNPTFGYLHGVFDRHRATQYSDPASMEAAGGQGNINLPYLLETFFHHPWFQRVWVIQEAILARTATVYSTSEAIDWKEVLLVNEITSSPEYTGSTSNLRMRNSMPSVWKTLIAHDRNHVIAADNLSSVKALLLPILQVFLAALDMKATDPRDKLFALLPFGQETGKVRKIPAALRPDYNKPLARVMADFTRWWILEYKSLDILSMVHRQPSRAWRRTLCDEDPAATEGCEAGGFPSWAVGVEGYAQWEKMTLGERFPGVFRAAGDTCLDEGLLGLGRGEGEGEGEGNGLALALRGWRLGSIVALGHPPKEFVCPYAPDDPDPDTANKNNTDNRSHSFDSSATSSDNDTALLKAIFHRIFDPSGRTGEWMLLGNNHDLGSIEPARLEQILDGHVYAHYGYLSTPEQAQCVLWPVEGGGGEGDSGTKYERYESNELPGCIEKCFFVMEDGRFGLCPWTAKEGDVVVVLNGGSVPYLVRELGEESGEKNYSLVGECFVQGAMMGAVLEDGITQSQVFVLQ